MFLRRSTSQIVYALRSYSIDRQGWPWPSALLLWATRLVPTAARRKPIVVAFGMSHHNRHQSLSLENGYDTSGLPNLRNAQCAGCRDFLQQGTGPAARNLFAGTVAMWHAASLPETIRRLYGTWLLTVGFVKRCGYQKE